tara:strand:- start:958 stop:1272 length:315 start_codon:yes stop_codon:yes gene_type:complete
MSSKFHAMSQPCRDSLGDSGSLMGTVSPFMERKMMKVIRIQQGGRIVEAAMIDEQIYMLPCLAYSEDHIKPRSLFWRLLGICAVSFVLTFFLTLFGLFSLVLFL